MHLDRIPKKKSIMSPRPQNFRDALLKEREYRDAVINRLRKKYLHYANDIKLKLEHEQTYVGAWYELMVYDWLWRQGKNPIPQPKVSNGNPDFVFSSKNKKIYVEVAAVQESKKDKERYETQDFILTQDTASFATMRERLIDKAGKYESIDTARDAYVICLGLESSLIDIEDVKSCFMTLVTL